MDGRREDRSLRDREGRTRGRLGTTGATAADVLLLIDLVKREALENVLSPYKLLENREMLIRSGFRYVDVFFKWYNFCGMIAVK